MIVFRPIFLLSVAQSSFSDEFLRPITCVNVNPNGRIMSTLMTIHINLYAIWVRGEVFTLFQVYWTIFHKCDIVVRCPYATVNIVDSPEGEQPPIPTVLLRS